MPDLISVVPEPLFYGHDAKSTRGDLSAEDFFDRQVANMAKPTAIDGEPEKIAATVAN